jgi:alkylation response protein AidB-like acyl-CoA dehydrogenase
MTTSSKKQGLTLEQHMKNIREFSIDKPVLQNPYLKDDYLQKLVQCMFPTEILKEIQAEFKDFGDAAAGVMVEPAEDCERTLPYLQQFNAFGERVDKIHLGRGWEKMKELAARMGVVAAGYDTNYGVHTRLFQTVRLLLWLPYSGMFGCPLAMTDGAARVLNGLLTKGGLPKPVHDKLKDAFIRLTSRDPSSSWTSGQWMTEKKGGSDVNRATETLAFQVKEHKYHLYGFKYLPIMH